MDIVKPENQATPRENNNKATVYQPGSPHIFAPQAQTNLSRLNHRYKVEETLCRPDAVLTIVMLKATNHCFRDRQPCLAFFPAGASAERTCRARFEAILPTGTTA